MAADKPSLVRAFFDALGSGNVETLKTLVTDDVEVITPGTALICGSRNYDVVMQICAAFPVLTKSGVRFHYLTFTSQDDRVACEMQGESTLINGQSYNNTYHFLVHFRGDKIRLVKEYLDTKLADEVLAPLLSP